jgi:hypothetical protein
LVHSEFHHVPTVETVGYDANRPDGTYCVINSSIGSAIFISCANLSAKWLPLAENVVLLREQQGSCAQNRQLYSLDVFRQKRKIVFWKGTHWASGFH